MNHSHHALVARAAAAYLNASAILRIHNGATWRDTAWPTLSAGGQGDGITYWTDRRGVTFSRSYRATPSTPARERRPPRGENSQDRPNRERTVQAWRRAQGS